MPDSSDLAAELEFVKALAIEAAAVAKKRCQTVTPQEKANLSYVTDLDQDLERLIRQRLGDGFRMIRSLARNTKRKAAPARGAGRSTRSTARGTWSTACRSGPSASA